MQEARVQFIRMSSNKKIGYIPATNSDKNTCPANCPLKNNGCYGENFHTNLNWSKITEGKRGGDWEMLCTQVKALPVHQMWRHNVTGDLPHENGRIDGHKLNQLVQANKRKHGFTYTHHDMSIYENRMTVHSANVNGFTINLSANSLAEADYLSELNIAPVAVVVPSSQMEHTQTPKGRRVRICPNSLNPAVQCSSCGLCAEPFRTEIIGFPAHGTRRKRVDALLEELCA